jgi:hypothetical protein
VHHRCFSTFLHQTKKDESFCIICRTQPLPPGQPVYWTKTKLSKKLEIFPHLVNAYFYNHHDLRIIQRESLSNWIVLISYPRKGIYTVVAYSYEQVQATGFRQHLLAFHSRHKCKYVFTDSSHPEPLYTRSGRGLLGAYDAQVKW